MINFKQAILIPLLIIIASCANFEEAQPETPRQVIAASKLTILGLTQEVVSLKQRGLIDDKQKNEVLDQLEAALSYVSDAEQSLRIYEATGNASTESNMRSKLDQVSFILTSIESILLERLK